MKNGPPPKEHPDNLTQLWKALESTWAIITVECFQHLVMSMHPRIEAVLMLEGTCMYSLHKSDFNLSFWGKKEWKECRETVLCLILPPWPLYGLFLILFLI
jgi:hypothetical protein